MQGSNQSILKEINSEYSLKRLMLKLKLQYFGPLKQRVDILENTLMLEKIENGATENEMVGWHYRLNEHEFEQNLGDWRAGKPGATQSVGLQRVARDLATKQPQSLALE